MKGIKLNVGCGPHVLPGWLNIDPASVEGVVYGLAHALPVASDSCCCAILFDVIEHLHPVEGAPAALREIHRVLQPGGVLRVSTPDARLLAQAYMDGTISSGRWAASQPEAYQRWPAAMQLSAHVFGNHAGNPGGVYLGHQAVYDEDWLAAMLREAGFREVQRQRPMESLSEVIRNEVRDRWAETALIMEAVKWR